MPELGSDLVEALLGDPALSDVLNCAKIFESAVGMGMTPFQVLRRVELPMAAPVMSAGVRTAAVQIVAGATLAAFIGGGGLGDFITTGIGMMAIERSKIETITSTSE